MAALAAIVAAAAHLESRDILTHPRVDSWPGRRSVRREPASPSDCTGGAEAVQSLQRRVLTIIKDYIVAAIYNSSQCRKIRCPKVTKYADIEMNRQ